VTLIIREKWILELREEEGRPHRHASWGKSPPAEETQDHPSMMAPSHKGAELYLHNLYFLLS
jgi:hypothetical protein